MRLPPHAANDVRFAPAYTLAEAARYLRIPEATLRNWISGRNTRSQPLFRIDDPKGEHLSFINLVEAHVLVAIRRRHGVKLPKVRKALAYVQRQFGIGRPLIDEAFQTNGLDLFVERYGELINASRDGQSAMREIISAYLERIERDSKGLPLKLYPFTRDSEAEPAPRSDPRFVVISADVSFGQPVIAGTGIPISAIFERYRAGDSVADLARDFQVDMSAVEEAIRCEAA